MQLRLEKYPWFRHLNLNFTQLKSREQPRANAGTALILTTPLPHTAQGIPSSFPVPGDPRKPLQLVIILTTCIHSRLQAPDALLEGAALNTPYFQAIKQLAVWLS